MSSYLRIPLISSSEYEHKTTNLNENEESMRIEEAIVVPPTEVVSTVTSSILEIPRNSIDSRAQFLIGNTERINQLKSQHLKTLGLSCCCFQVGSKSFSGMNVLPKELSLLFVCGGGEFDFTRARFVHPVTTIRVLIICGGAKIRIPKGVRVETRKTLSICGGVMAPQYDTFEAPTLDSPIIRFVGLTICGGAHFEISLTSEPLVIVREENASQIPHAVLERA